ncbi:ATP-dependent DNA ligase [Candidatus Dependentiae bacterium]|nr:ATP-dependent DNA ligase [Candidatus Dependentiae bacterium]MBU4386976.1 ATP-dependent DNA ligase [Candidatus Dependentiae bacterium]MCG2755896.1 ATP-dependent DNA ligase [Candidatus Dependentiae bacterium]
MKFIEVAKIFDLIEKESSRTEMTKLLADLFKTATPNQAAIISYLTLGELNPTYIGTQFNFASKSMIKVLAKFLNKSENVINLRAQTLGDLGLLIQEYDISGKSEPLTLNEVENYLQDFLKISGDGAVEKKEILLLELFEKLDSLSIKYVIRIILGKLRLGFSDMTLLDAFSWMYAGNKSIRLDLEEAYNVCVDIGMIIQVLKEDGLEKLKKHAIVTGIPVRPAAAERLPNAKDIFQKLGKCVAQPKLDGFRLQVHIDNTKSKPHVNFFSRNLQDMSDMFPDLKKAVLDLKVKTLVAEGEAIAYDVHTGTFLPFQETVKRKRKYDIEQTAQDFPLKLYFFDLLYLNGESFLDKTHEERRKKLLTVATTKKEDTVFVVEEKEINSAKELEKYFEENISLGLEGLVVKKTDALYQAGKRNFNWIKLKRQESGHLDDTIDCVILGYYKGKGKRATFGIGALLVGIYNKKQDSFQTVAKIGTGLTDLGLKEVKEKCDQIKVVNRPKNVECAKELYPDVWTSPEIVCLIRADEITLSPLHSAGKTEDEDGLALRFPRFMGYRPDKSAYESTSLVELKELYSLQFEGKEKKSKRRLSKKTKIKDEIDKKILSIF